MTPDKPTLFIGRQISLVVGIKKKQPCEPGGSGSSEPNNKSD